MTLVPYTVSEVTNVVDKAMRGFALPESQLARTFQTVLTIAVEIGIPKPSELDHALRNISRAAFSPSELREEFLWECVLQAHIEKVQLRAAGISTERGLVQPGEDLQYSPFSL